MSHVDGGLNMGDADANRCWGSVTEPGGMGFNVHRCSRQGKIRIQFTGPHEGYYPLFWPNEAAKDAAHVIRLREESWCVSHWKSDGQHVKDATIIAGQEFVPVPVVEKTYTFEFTAIDFISASSEEEAREKFRKRYHGRDGTIREVR
jgi:hypothetical protein